MSEQKQNTQQIGLTVSLAGIVELFGNKLYNEFGAIVRELVQNGHDAALIDIATVSQGKKTLSDYWINVRFDGVARKLILTDNGIGMDNEDVSKNLNDFAKPKKREVREALATSLPTQPLYIIGIYGVGFLSALAISETVEVWTRRANQQPLLWRYKKGSEFASVTDITEEDFAELYKRHGVRTEADATGTIVICHLSEQIEKEYSITTEAIETSLLQYGRLLRVPIYFNGKKINNAYVAWDNPSGATIEDWHEMIKDFTQSKPLLVIPIYSPPDELDLEGVLWVPERKSILGDRGHIDIYIRRMFVTQDDYLILPRWASFILGMVNSNKLDRIVSGTDIIRDEHLGSVREFIKEKIVDALNKLRELPENEYWKVVGGYDDILKLSAAENKDFLDCIWDKLRIRVRNRRLTIPEYLAEVKLKTGQENTLYYYNKSVQEFSASLVSDATRIPVLSLWTLNDSEFVYSLCARKNFQLLPYTELAVNIIKKPIDEGTFQSLIVACAASNIAAEIREFEPLHMPALLIEDNDLEDRRKEWLKMMQSTSHRVDKKIAGEMQNTFFRSGTLNRDVSFYLNAANPLIKSLRGATFETQQAICWALYNVSYMSIMPQLGRDEIEGIYNSICSVLMTLVNQGAKPEEELEVCRAIRIFMITPFSDKYINLEQSVREVFEGPPYFFQVVLARDFMHESQLLEDIRAHIEAADGFIAEISDLNPNVMLELGAVLVKKEKNKPVFLLKEGSNVRGELPADLRSELYISYQSLTDEPTQIADAIRKLIELNGKPTHRDIINLVKKRTCKALTKQLLRQTRCSESEQHKILKSFDTVESLLAVSPKQIVSVTGVTSAVADFIQNQLKEFIEEVNSQ